jgi:hypothetical protein
MKTNVLSRAAVALLGVAAIAGAAGCGESTSGTSSDPAGGLSCFDAMSYAHNHRFDDDQSTTNEYREKALHACPTADDWLRVRRDISTSGTYNINSVRVECAEIKPTKAAVCESIDLSVDDIS